MFVGKWFNNYYDEYGAYIVNLSKYYISMFYSYSFLCIAESKIEAQTSPARLKARIGKDVTLWCNATGYPRPVVYWTREDSNRKLPDGTYQFWVINDTNVV